MGIKFELKLRKLGLSVKDGFDPDQPRDDDGRWTDGDTGGEPSAFAEEYIDPVIAELEEIAWGHHKVPRGVFNSEKYDFPDDVLDVFENATTGQLNDPSSNYFDGVHRDYSKAVEEQLDEFLERNKIRGSDMTPEHARSFTKEIEKSSDPRIRRFNMRLLMRESLYWYRRGPRGRE
jgi:hypothetical protein